MLLCAETQERYCWALPEDFAAEACEIYNREFALGAIYPGAGARVIGRANRSGYYRVRWEGELIVDCPIDAITVGRRTQRPARRRPPPAPVKPRRRAPDLHGALLDLLGTWNGCSREYLFRHFDSEVQGRTWLRPGEADATVIRVHPGRAMGLALAVGGNPHWCRSDPELGARHAVAEATRNVACEIGRASCRERVYVLV